ncbi:tRNA pseudouridine(55) synthase TruB [Lutibacter sp.]|uniref:tRNA pseudouridine(55) synthase TruB n=1 Tax=Lutibacter sp. TaxID=1925666 RepID=UPI00273745F7|nr:tRNA pseudouridine(55) synthase TruB [Lutibacter sp.]MDP3313645.1 tRNA pseudouridine(55) synthase TruB [Lutibacter sp.]
MLTLEDFKSGQVLLIDKPLNWTSFQVVNKLRWNITHKFNIKKLKVGHAGTLDPLATGLLIICTGNFTKKIDEYQAQIKEYTGELTLGATTPSYDLETEINQIYSTEHITKELIYDITKLFIGEIDQKPPIFSAIKKEGRRLYEIAREGNTVEIEARKITINEFEITKIDFPRIEFRVVCSKGTYIRSLAYDFGKALNCGAHLSQLRRTKIGNFHINNGITIDDFIANL